MKQSLQLRLGQQLTMTPQLQQAIRLLQLSTLELRTEVQQALESNLMLELAEDGDDGDLPSGDSDEVNESDDYRSETDKVTDSYTEIASDIPRELPVDSAWDDIYESITPAGSRRQDDGDREVDFGHSGTESLNDYLLWQLRLSMLGETDRTIGETIIDAINEDGYLTLSLEEIHEGLAADLDVEMDEVEAVLHAIQNFDPPGVAAPDLRGSLLLQLRQLPESTAWLKQGRQLIEDHFQLLAIHDYTQLKRRMKLDEAQLSAIIELIRSLNPRPGSQISDTRIEYIVPDVIVRKASGSWRVELNHEATPKLRINRAYAALSKKTMSSSDAACMKNHLQEARWFIKSLQSRNETLLKVATCIVEHQREFLEHGEIAMKPLVLHDIAREVDMHESTISRVTNKKYMHTPRGIFELKYFFSSHVGTVNGGECSSTAIRALIRKMVAEENSTKPLSDNRIAGFLKEQGINVARRTVAKYREAMAIPPSNERKRLV